MAVQRFERNVYYHLAVHCPFCGHLVAPADADLLDDLSNEPAYSPCPHTLYIAHDAAFEFISDRAEKALRDMSCRVTRGDDGSLEIDVDDDDPGMDALTDRIEFHDALKVASYVSAPGDMGSYVGFAPTGDE